MSYIKTQGDLHEKAALKTMGGDAYNLNREAASGVVGHQYPTFDICSSTELASVKSHISQPGQCTTSDIAAYKADFNHMLGWDRAYERGLSPLEQDAERLSSLPGKGFAVPSAINGVGQEGTVNYLKNNSIMRIPDDHVTPVRQAMEQDVRALPENYFLPENPTDEQVQGVLSRIQGTGLSSIETARQMNRQNQTTEQVEGAVKDLAVEGATEAVPEVAVVEQVVNSEEVQQAEEDAVDAAGAKLVATDASQPDQALSQGENPAYETSQSQEDTDGESEGYQYGMGY